MRNTRITALGIVVFLFLQAALSSCLRIGGKPKYDIDEDSLFFSRMPPRTETGANIVAFELDGKPYVFPKEGMRDYFHFLGSYPNWYCYLNPIPLDEDSLLRMSFRWDASRLGKKYNSNTVAIRMDNLDEDLKKIPFSKKGTLRINSYSSDKIIFFVTKYLPEQHLLCGTFSGTLYEGEGENMRKVGLVKNGFFDLEYRTQQ